MNPELLTIKQTAAKAKNEGMNNIAETGLRRWIADGMLRVVPVGNRNLICWDTLMEFLRTGVDSFQIGLPRQVRTRRGKVGRL